MKNSDKPIHPLRGADGTIFKDDGYLQSVDCLTGLSKREYFAALAMKGLLAANPKYTHGNVAIPVPSMIATYAVEYADALLNELDKTPTP